MGIFKIINKYLDYVNDNMLLIMKAFFLFALPILGAISAVLLRRGGSNYATIIYTGIILEILGMALFALFIRSDYKKIGEEIKPPYEK
ncbi:MAG: hypothetical protein ACTSO9_00055 [Candidatus Helarchaeota archaeon]